MTTDQFFAFLMLSPLFLLALAFTAWSLAQIIKEERARIIEQRRRAAISHRIRARFHLPSAR